MSIIQEDQDLINEAFHGQDTTAGVSCITWNKAYSLYPHELLIQREYYTMQKYSERLARSQKALAKEGLLMRRYPSLTSPEMCYVTARPRRIGDEHTLVIDLDTAGIESSGQPDGILEVSTFRLRWIRDEDDDDDWYPPQYRGHCTLHCHPIRYPVLEYTYGVLSAGERGF
ncbi:hypothetical protein BKA63DRAFT_524330 [Paraphoma chrysanthemicola]|nr:hypothetical protein BKA63DRAFT_524330 [Paraphoma chrysanthemicola]